MNNFATAPLTALSIHSAPSVVYPLGRSRFQGGVLALCWLAGMSIVVAWGAQQPWDWRLATGYAAVLLAGWAALAGYRNLPSGQLSWDGQMWRWESPVYQTGIAEYELSVIADFQRVLVLRLQNQAGARLWLCAERSARPERWLDLRRAAHFSVPSAATTAFRGDAALFEVDRATDVAVSAHAHRDPLSKP